MIGALIRKAASLVLPPPFSWIASGLSGIGTALRWLWRQATRWPLEAIIITLLLVIAWLMLVTIPAGKKAIARQAATIDKLEKANTDFALKIEAASRKYATVFNAIEKARKNEISHIRRDRDALLVSVRARSNRPSGYIAESEAIGKGGTGASLFARDAEFLVGEAARADEQRAALNACYLAYDAASIMLSE